MKIEHTHTHTQRINNGDQLHSLKWNQASLTTLDVTNTNKQILSF